MTETDLRAQYKRFDFEDPGILEERFLEVFKNSYAQ